MIAKTIESFKEVVIGESPFDIEKLYHRMYCSLIVRVEFTSSYVSHCQSGARDHGRTNRSGPENTGSRDSVLGRGHRIRRWLGVDRSLPGSAGGARRQWRHVYLVALASAIAGAWAYGLARRYLPH